MYEYDFMQKNNIFGLDMLYRKMPKKAFIKGKKQEIEGILMYCYCCEYCAKINIGENTQRNYYKREIRHTQRPGVCPQVGMMEEHIMITDIQEKQLGKDSVYREGKLYCKLWDKEISVMLFDEDVTIEYAEKCAEAVNSMPPELVNAICIAAKKYCIEFCEEISDEWGMVVESPQDPTRIGYQLECNCDWEEEHGMEIDILDNKLVYLSSYNR